MQQNDVPIYNDPMDFETLGENAKFPCSTQYMVYNAILHRYSLTPDGLTKYGIDAERKYISDHANKVEELIEKTSKKVYDYIFYKAGLKCYQIMMYRIATSPKIMYPDQYFMRKQFEQVLADQAKHIVENGDSARYSAYNMESDMQQPPFKPEDAIRNNTDMSPECMRTLDTLNLLKWFAMQGSNLKPDLKLY